MEKIIEGVEFKELVTHGDSRGFFREIIRVTDDFFPEFAQWSHSYMYSGVIKAWHYHKIQNDFFYVCNGVIRVGLYDMREDSSTYKQTMDFMMGDHQKPVCVKIPPGVVHGVKAIEGPANLFYVMDKTYDPSDEYRIAYDDPEIGFDWHKDWEIS